MLHYIIIIIKINRACRPTHSIFFFPYSRDIIDFSSPKSKIIGFERNPSPSPRYPRYNIRLIGLRRYYSTTLVLLCEVLSYVIYAFASKSKLLHFTVLLRFTISYTYGLQWIECVNNRRNA